MKVNIEHKNPKVKAKDAQFGHIYLYMQQYIMCFEPCKVHQQAAEGYTSDSDAKHFVRINEKDTMSLILIGEETIEYVGEAQVSLV